MPCSNLRFLVVEDHPVQRRLAVTLLRSLGATVIHEAEDGQQALQVTRDPSRPLDIVITDISMPGMDGMEMMRNLASAASPVSLILNSALSPPVLASVANMAVAYGIQLLGVISKPIAALKLVPLVDLHREMRSQTRALPFSLAEIAGGLSRGEFDTLYEPRVDMATSDVLGFHAVAHWQRPDQALLAPPDFMPSIQAYGLADNLAWTCLSKAVRQAAAWIEQGRPVRISASIPAISLADPDVGRRAARAAREAGLQPELVTLAVPASVIERQTALDIETLARIRVAGFGLALEGFGASDVPKDHLARLPLTELHLAGQLLSGSDPSGRAELVVALDTAQQLRLPVIARDLKSLDQWNLLQGWGCTGAQGPFVSPPMKPSRVSNWLDGRPALAGAKDAMGKPLELTRPGASMPAPARRPP